MNDLKSKTDESGKSDTDSSSENTDSNNDGSFIVLFDDAPNGDAESKADIVTADDTADDTDEDGASRDKKDESFVILFSDEDNTDEACQTQVDDEGNCSVKLPGDIRVSRINDIKDNLIQSMDAKGVSIDASNVRHVDTSSVQLLRSYCVALDEIDIPVNWSAVSEELETTASRLGIGFSA